MRKVPDMLDLSIRNVDLSKFNKFLYQTSIDMDGGDKHQNCIEFKETLKKFKKLYLREYPLEVELWFKKFNFELANQLMKKHGYEFHIVISLYNGTPTYGMRYTGKCEIDCIHKGSSLFRKWKMDELLVFLGTQEQLGDMDEKGLIKFLNKFMGVWKQEFGLGSDELSKYLDIRNLNYKLEELGVPYRFDYDESAELNRKYRIKKVNMMDL